MATTTFPTCAYCGINRPTTDDHVLPRKLFPSVTNPAIVPACKTCNVAKSKDDEYLRDIFAVREENYDLPELAGVRERALRSAAREGRYAPIRQMLKTMGRRDIRLASGLFVGQALTVQAEANRYYRALVWIRRGLHFWVFRAPLPCETTVAAWGYTGHENKVRFDALWPTTSGYGPVDIGENFRFQFRCLPGRPDAASWGMVFFRRVFVLLNTNEHMWLAAEQARGWPITRVFAVKPRAWSPSILTLDQP